MLCTGSGNNYALCGGQEATMLCTGSGNNYALYGVRKQLCSVQDQENSYALYRVRKQLCSIQDQETTVLYIRSGNYCALCGPLSLLLYGPLSLLLYVMVVARVCGGGGGLRVLYDPKTQYYL